MHPLHICSLSRSQYVLLRQSRKRSTFHAGGTDAKSLKPNVPLLSATSAKEIHWTSSFLQPSTDSTSSYICTEMSVAGCTLICKICVCIKLQNILSNQVIKQSQLRSYSACRKTWQTMSHTVESCQLPSRFPPTTTTVVSPEPFPDPVKGIAEPVERHGVLQTLICAPGETQTKSHIVKSCPLTKLNGGLSQLHSADAAAIAWLTNIRKKKKKKKK